MKYLINVKRIRIFQILAISLLSVSPAAAVVKVLTWNVQPECERVRDKIGENYGAALKFINVQAKTGFDFFGFQVGHMGRKHIFLTPLRFHYRCVHFLLFEVSERMLTIFRPS